MFISKSKRPLTALGIAGAAVALWGGLLFAMLRGSNAEYFLFFTTPLVAFTAYTVAQALIPEVPRAE